MGNIWQQEGLDLRWKGCVYDHFIIHQLYYFRLLPYGCLSTGHRVGFIEIVRKSETIANIQKEKSGRSRLGWDSSVLYTWLKEKNPTEPQYAIIIHLVYIYTYPIAPPMKILCSSPFFCFCLVACFSLLYSHYCTCNLIELGLLLMQITESSRNLLQILCRLLCSNVCSWHWWSPFW